MKIIAPTSGDIKSISGKLIGVDHSYPTVNSTKLDAVFIPDGTESMQTLSINSFAVLFVKEDYKRGKGSGAGGDGDGILLINKAGA